MTAPIPKTKIEEILEELGVFGRKNASELTIHRWKIKAKSIENIDIIQYKRLLAIIAVYENQYELAKQYFEQAISLSGNENPSLYSDYGQSLLMIGKAEEAIECFLKEFSLMPSEYILERIISASISFLYLEGVKKVSSLIKELKIKNDIFETKINETTNTILINLEFLKEINVSVMTYRAVIALVNSVLFQSYYTEQKFAYYHLDKKFNVILYPIGLTVEEITELNDEFSNRVVELDIPFEELLKLSVYFSFYVSKEVDVA